MKHIYRWGCGRATTFALLLLVAGISLSVAHRLDASFVGLAGVIQVLLTARAISEDHAPKRTNWHEGEAAK